MKDCCMPMELRKHLLTLRGWGGQIGSLLGNLSCVGSPLGDCFGPMINTASGDEVCNAFTVPMVRMGEDACTCRMGIMASKAIAKGSEVFLVCGESYSTI